MYDLLMQGVRSFGWAFLRTHEVMTMTARQKKFAEYYAACGNASDAARHAGYSSKFAAQNADKLLKNTNISDYIRALSERAQTERILTVTERQAMLSDLARDESEDAADRIRAIDTLNKMTGEYTVKVEAQVETSGKLADIFDQLGGEGLHE